MATCTINTHTHTHTYKYSHHHIARSQERALFLHVTIITVTHHFVRQEPFYTNFTEIRQNKSPIAPVNIQTTKGVM